VAELDRSVVDGGERAGQGEPDASPWYGGLLSRRFQFFLDLLALVAAFVLAYLLRFDFRVPADVALAALGQLPYVVLVQLVAFLGFGIYSFIWRYVGLADLPAFLKAAVWATAPLVLLRLGLPDSLGQWRVPLSVILIDAGLAFGGLLGLRVLRRSLYERYEARRRQNQAAPNGDQAPVLLAGAGRAGVMVAKEIAARGDMGLRVVGFVDDDPEKLGSQIQGVKVLGTTENLPELVRRHGVDHVVITIADTSRLSIRRIVEICEQIPIKVRIVPGLYEIVQGNVAVSRIRDVEIEDLLGRAPVQLDTEELARFLSGRVVLVSGAGGSIGSELVRQIACFAPAALVLVERAEFALFEIEREVVRRFPAVRVVPVVADVGDATRLRAVLERERPRVVLHAAAHKHVPLMEENPAEAVKNNVLATAVLAELAGEVGVEAFVFLSTDKAVRPTSVMGASKRLGELVIQALDQRYATRYVAVRFGNVMGSTGSVIPIFREQIARGGPVTVTHPEMQRYFMTIPEAAQLVLQAGAMGQGGEIFILDMGRPVKIVDLAYDMITLSGLRPGEDIEITFTGLRPGEKLSEELALTGEQLVATRHPAISIGRLAVHPPAVIDQALAQLRVLCAGEQEDDVRLLLGSLLPEARLTTPTPPTTPLPTAAPAVAQSLRGARA
jgi:FlaA1/EpsC-like NDP-sugar epimerase